MSRADELLEALRLLGLQVGALRKAIQGAQSRLGEDFRGAGMISDADECLASISQMMDGLRRAEAPIKTPPFCIDVGGHRFNSDFAAQIWLRDLVTDLQAITAKPISLAGLEAALDKIAAAVGSAPPQTGANGRKGFNRRGHPRGRM